MMYNRMREQMMHLLSDMASVNFADAPNYKLMVALCARFKADNIPDYVAERLAASMSINISQACSDDQELMQKVVSTYADALLHLLTQIKQDFPSCAYDVLLIMASQFKIEMDF